MFLPMAIVMRANLATVVRMGVVFLSTQMASVCRELGRMTILYAVVRSDSIHVWLGKISGDAGGIGVKERRDFRVRVNRNASGKIGDFSHAGDVGATG